MSFALPSDRGMTKVVNLRRGEECDVRIDQTTKYGNPFHRLGLPRGQSIALYRTYLRWVLTWIDSEFLEPLRGKRLGCWCSPEPCHGDVIVEFLNERSSA